ncbi:MAG: adenylosuccinate lyase [Candidatus Omnitrophica bacterium]|nr:adenylosuccinate lyase [Candidatus Omnitrophota bacterium]MCG2705265.1 adenylosuccinate lyase [Candidatus Omnitrophota bacterium]
MIQRYSLPKMRGIWSEENRIRKMAEIELIACEAMAKYGIIPKKAYSNIKDNLKFDVERIKEIEKETNHDVVAFIINLSENIGEDAKYLHKGLTSSDVLDTSLSVMMVEAADIIIDDLNKLCGMFKRKARKYKHTPMMGRSHGVHAEPITFGLKMALFYDETKRSIDRIKRAKEIVRVGKISGAVGTYANVDPRVEEFVCKKLGLKAANVSTQILQRDRHAEYLAEIAVIGSSLDKFAVEFRALQRTEVGEVEEFFLSTQKGSSAMPHKKNPIMCERISGLARILRANSIAGLENVALWHERDISHSSVERIILPDSTILLDYMLNKFIDIVQNLVVHPLKMMENIEISKGIIFSQRVLLELIEKGLTRLEAYDMIQKSAMEARETGEHFRDVLLRDEKIKEYLNEYEIEKCFDLKYHLKHVDRIFTKVGI